MRPVSAPRRAFCIALTSAALLCGVGAELPAQSLPLTDTETIVTPGQPAPVVETFTTTSAGAYKITLNDLGVSQGSALAGASLAITQGATVAATLAALPQSGSATLTLNAAANTTYTIRVVAQLASGTPSGAVGLIVLAPDGSMPFSVVDAISAPPTPVLTRGLLIDQFSASADCTCSLSLNDLALPAAFASGSLVLRLDALDQSLSVTLPLPPPAPPGIFNTTVTLRKGVTYQVVAAGANGAATGGGLFSVSVLDSTGLGPYPARLVPVGAVQAVGAAMLTGPGSGSLNFTLNDLHFPAALQTVGAVLVGDNGLAAGTALSAAGSAAVTLLAGSHNYQAFAFAQPQSAAAGSVAVALAAPGAAPVLAGARAIADPASGLQPFSFDVMLPGAGTYEATLTDFAFPAKLKSASLGLAANASLLGSLANTGQLAVNATQGGPATVLVLAQGDPTSGSLLGVNLGTSSSNTPLLDVTQGVGIAFKSTRIKVAAAGQIQVVATDLKFPAALGNFSIAVTQGNTVVGTVLSAGGTATLPLQAMTGDYTLNLVAQPASGSTAGTYSLTAAAAPTVSLQASSPAVVSGTGVTLTWSSTGATACTAAGGAGFAGSETPAGNVTTTALIANSTFTLTCTGPGGTGTSSVTVRVDAKPSGGGGGGAFDGLALLALTAGLLGRRRSRGPPGY